jgi:hypothetical protein
MARLATFWLLAAPLLGGCAALQDAPTEVLPAAAPTSASEAEIESEVLATIQTVKGVGSRRVLGSRSVRLPTREHYEITVFDYELPATCGGYRFRVYETGNTQILEYTYEQGSSGPYLVRDYVAGPSRFIRPGLWSSYDHTADGVSNMMTLFTETNSPLMPSAYSRGFGTDLAERTQRELDSAYREAVKAASHCTAALSAGPVARG